MRSKISFVGNKLVVVNGVVKLVLELGDLIMNISEDNFVIRVSIGGFLVVMVVLGNMVLCYFLCWWEIVDIGVVLRFVNLFSGGSFELNMGLL